MNRPDEASVFGLQSAELRPVIENIAGEPITGFQTRIEHQVGGHCGYSARKLIPTFEWTARSGTTGQTTVFVKWYEEPGLQEAHHYEGLMPLGAPIPRLYGAVRMPDGTEMIFLEYLEPTDDLHPFDRFVMDDEAFTQFLSTAARFNALRPQGRYASSLPPGEPLNDGWARKVAQCLERLWSCARDGKLGEANSHRKCNDS